MLSIMPNIFFSLKGAGSKFANDITPFYQLMVVELLELRNIPMVQFNGQSVYYLCKAPNKLRITNCQMEHLDMEQVCMYCSYCQIKEVQILGQYFSGAN